MQLLYRARLALNFDEDALAAHRNSIGLRLCGLIAVAMAPIALFHLLKANWSLFAVTLVIGSVASANTWSLRRGNPPTVPFWVLCCLALLGVLTSLRLHGTYGVLWTYPTLFLFFFVLPRRQAMVLASVLLVASTAIATVSLGLPLSVRMLLSLGFMLVMIHIVLNMLGELQQALVLREFAVRLASNVRAIDLLEVIDVDHQHGHRLAARSRSAHQRLELAGHVASIVQTRELVGDGLRHDLGGDVVAPGLILRRLVVLLGEGRDEGLAARRVELVMPKIIEHFEKGAKFDLLKTRPGYFRASDHQLMHEMYAVTALPADKIKNQWDIFAS
eukprot:gene33114-44327_t